uniref:Uncharacterized protein n=1 Tax=Rhizophora mucronata TaxID=61149 RepID=A0A2P2MI07_RHIMU
MSREEFEAWKANMRRRREHERKAEREFSRDRDFAREMSSSGDVSSVKSVCLFYDLNFPFSYISMRSAFCGVRQQFGNITPFIFLLPER